jgi:hypothetical protein
MARKVSVMPAIYDPTGMKGEPGEGSIVQRDCIHVSKVAESPRDFLLMPKLPYMDRVDDGGAEEDE